MANPQLVIDIGSKFIKVTQVRAGKSGVEIVKAGKEPLLLPPKADNETIYNRTEEVLPMLLQRLGIKQKRAIVTLPGRAAFTRQFKIPIVRGRQLSRIVKYEARQHIPFPLEQVNLDFQVSGTSEASNELEINMVAVRKESADAYTKILKKNKIRADIIEAAPLSIYNAYAASTLHEPDEVSAVVCIGASSTDIVIEQNGYMQFMRSAPVAGNMLTGLIAKNLDIEQEKAEALKKKTADQISESEDGVAAEQVASVLEQGFENIVTEIRRSFDFYVSQPDANPVTRVLLCGGTVQMEGVTEFIEDRLGVPVSLFEASQVEMVQIPDDLQNDLRFEAALIGMAVRATGKASCGMSFAPVQIKQRLELERRAPKFAVMGVLIAGMIGASAYGLQTKTETMQQSVNQVQMIIQPGEEAAPELQDVRQTQDQYQNRFVKIGEVADKRGSLSRVFLEVQNLIPQDVWLESIEVTSANITVKGRALNDERIARYMEGLQNSPFFDNNAVALADSAPLVESLGNESSAQIGFELKILEYSNPSREEIEFSRELRKLMKGTTILLNKIVRDDPEDNNSPGHLILGLFADEVDGQDDLVSILNRVITALNKAGDETVQDIEIRLHDRSFNWIKDNPGIKVTREEAEQFANRTMSQQDFVDAFAQLVASPTIPPTPTPTPDPDQQSREEQQAGGGYGGMMGGYGGMGMGGY